jgi:hypothetical protein
MNKLPTELILNIFLSLKDSNDIINFAKTSPLHSYILLNNNQVLDHFKSLNKNGYIEYSIQLDYLHNPCCTSIEHWLTFKDEVLVKWLKCVHSFFKSIECSLVIKFNNINEFNTLPKMSHSTIESDVFDRLYNLSEKIYVIGTTKDFYDTFSKYLNKIDKSKEIIECVNNSAVGI